MNFFILAGLELFFFDQLIQAISEVKIFDQLKGETLNY